MRVAILGTGALGCVFSARLAERAEVWMLGTWAEGIAAVQRNGIRVHEPDGRVRLARPPAVADPAVVPPCEIVLLLVKSYQTQRAAAWAAQIMAPDGVSVTLQNGLDNSEKIAAVVGQARTVVGVTYIGATLLGPGEALFAANLPTYVGRNATAGKPVADLISLLNTSGLEAYAADNTEGRLWGKALANAAINPLTALWHVPNGEVCANADRRAVLAALAEEVAAVAHARAVALPFEDAVEHAESVCRATAANRSSMLQDIDRGRPTEIDSINGVVVAEGRRLGIPTPFNEVVWRLVRGLTG